MEKKIEKIERVVETIMPEGRYTGKLCGNVITIQTPECEWRLKTSVSIRGWADVTVDVDENNNVSFTL